MERIVPALFKLAELVASSAIGIVPWLGRTLEAAGGSGKLGTMYQEYDPTKLDLKAGANRSGCYYCVPPCSLWDQHRSSGRS